jgi:predicted RNA-binding protein with PIN domain
MVGNPPRCPVNTLIDGYNLMYAVGSAPPPNSTPTALANARKRLLDWLADCPPVKADPAAVRVVFDAQNSKKDYGTTSHRGIVVTYSFRQTADDLIEALVAVHRHPRQLRVVSNDSRLREFARHKKCQHLSCGQFVDWLLSPPKQSSPSPPPPDDKPKSDWPDEFDTLMKAFG